MKTGRPKREFDWKFFDYLCGLEAPEEYCAEWILKEEGREINKHSIKAAIKMIQRRIRERFNLSFVEYRDKRLDSRRLKLREWQWKAAEKGNVTMQIWLGKQYLGQTEKVEKKTEVSTERTEIVYRAEWGGTAESDKVDS